MKVVTDPKKIILSIGAIVAIVMATPAATALSTASIIAQVANALSGLHIKKHDKIEKKLKKVISMAVEEAFIDANFEFDQCDKITENCFSIQNANDYFLASEPISALASRIKSQVTKHVDDKEYFEDYDFNRIVESILSSIENGIQEDEVLNDLHCKIINLDVYDRIKKIEEKLSNNSADENDCTPRSRNRFHYSANNVKFFGRNDELKQLKKFCDYDENMQLLNEKNIPFSWWLVSGQGGAGKSRLCFEFANLMRNHGWSICALPQQSHTFEFLNTCSEKLPNNTLFVLDYSEYYSKSIGKWMSTLISNKYNNIRIRVLLVQRRALISSTIIDTLSSEQFSLKAFLYDTLFNDGVFLEIQPLGSNDLFELQKSYAISQGKPISDEITKKIYDRLVFIDNAWVRPLFSLILTDAYLEKEEITLKWKRSDILEYINEKERELIKIEISKRYNQDVKLQDFGLDILAIATMTNGTTKEEIQKFFPEYDTYLNELDTILSEQKFNFYNIPILFNEGICPPLEPDIIGEYFVLRHLQKTGKGKNLINMAWKKLFEMSRFVQRLYQDYDDDTLGEFQSLLKEVSIPEGMTEIPNEIFLDNNNLLKIEMPCSIARIGEYAFSGCTSLKEIKIPKSVTHIGHGAFVSCSSLVDIELPNLNEIEGVTFWQCKNLSEIIIPESVTHIGEASFVECISLTKLSIPKSVTTIEREAFLSCKSLLEIEMYDTIVIGDLAFSDCGSLKNVYVHGQITDYIRYSFDDTDITFHQIPYKTDDEIEKRC